MAGCTHPSGPPPAAALQSANHKLLDEINRSGRWFHARKTRAIWVKQLAADQTVSTLEGPVQARAGDFLCRGEAGELWPQKVKDLESRYSPTDRVDAEGWRQYAPRPDAEGVMAAQVAHPFEVQAKWGRLAGKAGDYVAKNFRDRAVPYPEDVWVVDQKLFQATYQAVSRQP